MENVNILESYVNYLQYDPEEVLNEILLNESVSSKVKKLLASYKKNIKIAEDVLKKHSIDVRGIERSAKIAAIKAKESFSVGDREAVLRIWREDLKKVLESRYVKVAGKVALSILIMVAITHLNSFFFSSLAIVKVLGIPITWPTEIVSRTGYIVVAGAIGPFLEELGKRVAILGKFPWLYTGIFAAVEFFGYLATATPMGIRTFALWRAVGVVFHFVLTYIQKTFHGVSLKDNKKYLSYLGFLVAFLLHGCFNIRNILSS